MDQCRAEAATAAVISDGAASTAAVAPSQPLDTPSSRPPPQLLRLRSHAGEGIATFDGRLCKDTSVPQPEGSQNGSKGHNGASHLPASESHSSPSPSRAEGERECVGISVIYDLLVTLRAAGVDGRSGRQRLRSRRRPRPLRGWDVTPI